MKALSKKVRIGKLRIPVWAMALAGAAIVAAAAGQAVGPVLSASVSGSAGLVVQQSLVLATSSGISAHGGSDKAVLAMNDEGTSFTAAMELHVGDYDNFILLDVDNNSDSDANAILELSVPRGVDVMEDSGTSAQMSATQWLFPVGAGSSQNIQIRVSPKDDLKPGFYTISGRISQVSG